MIPAKSCDEEQRLQALRQYDILDTPDEQAFDEITQLVAQICQAPIAVVNFVERDRQWFKSEIGLGVKETHRDVSICAHAILQPGLFIVPDTLLDPRFKDNPLVTGVPHLRFYAGALLKSADGFPLGTLCVLDYQPRELTPEQQFALLALSRQVMSQMELRVANRELRRAAEENRRLFEAAQELNERLQRSIQETHHRVKNNLQIISALAEIQVAEGLQHVPIGALARIGQHTRSLAALHDLLTHQAKSGATHDTLSVKAAVDKLIPLLQTTTGGRLIRYQTEDFPLSVRKIASLVLLIAEIVSNAVKHGHGDIELSLTQSDAMAHLEVCDDGPGFPPAFNARTAANTGLDLIDSAGRYDLRGHISYTNRVEGGARVLVVFPIQPESF